MRSPTRAALALGLAAAAAAPAGCQAFFVGVPPAAPAPSTAQCSSAATATTTTSHSGHSRYISSARSRAQLQSRRGGGALLPLCMSGDDEAAPATKSPSELMNDAAEADFVARASTAPTVGPAMGPAKQPEEDKRKEREKRFELNKRKENKWASGAFKRGVALQAVVLSFVIFLQLKPAEVGQLAICAPFSKATGCVGFVEWVQIVFLNAPVPPM
eukprot:g13167.t1